MRRPLADKRPIGPIAQLGVPRGHADTQWPWREPTKQEIDDIVEYHIDELGMDPDTARRHADEEYVVVLDEFIPDDDGYRGRVIVAFADQVHNFAVYVYRNGELDAIELR